MKKILFRVKTILSLSCRNEYIFLRFQFLYSLLPSFIGNSTEESILQFIVFYYLYLLPR